MKQRLQTLLTTEKIASSKFADLLGVNRSSISHLLSGRNNPSLDFLQKVLIKFPHINPDWLLLGQGPMHRNNAQSQIQSSLSSNTLPFNDIIIEEKVKGNQIKPAIEPKKPKNEKNEVYLEEDESVRDIKTGIKTPENKKSIDKIVFFYSDNSFESYYPNKNDA